MGRPRTPTGAERRESTPCPVPSLTPRLLTSRLHIDLQRVCSAISRTG